MSMAFQKLKGITIDKFIISEKEECYSGIIYTLSRSVINGNTIWAGKSFRIVLPYKFLVVNSVFLITTVFINLYLHPENVKWFRSFMDVAYILGTLGVCTMMMAYAEEIKDLSIALDKWWSYIYLEEERNRIKNNTENKIKMITVLGFYFLNTVGSCYVLTPFLKYFYNGCKNVTDMMVVRSLEDVPWIYFEIFSGVVVIYTTTNSAGHLLGIFVGVTFIATSQLRLAAMAFLSIESRASKIMTDFPHRFEQFNAKTYKKLVQKELKSCAIHYQSVYRYTIKWYQSVSLITNYIFYDGCIVFIVLGVMLVKRAENLFLLLLTIPAVFFVQYSLSYTSETLMDEVENLRLTVYGSRWYTLPLSSQKNLHIMQTMLLYSPKMKSVFGSEITSEFFSKIVNAGYCYLTAILSMDLK